MKLPGFADTLRFKLIVASLIIQVVFVTVLVINSSSLLQESLLEQSQLRMNDINHLLSTSLGPALVQQDIELIDEIIEKNLKSEGIIYAALLDSSKRLISESNWDQHHHLPFDSETIEATHIFSTDHFDAKTEINMQGEHYGTLYYGISLDFLESAKENLIDNSIIISIFGIAISMSVMLFSVLWLTRHLSTLAEASDLFAQGKLKEPVPVRSNDEVAYLTDAFNTMVKVLDARILELHESQKQQENSLVSAQAEQARLTSLLSVMTRGILFETLEHRIAYYNPALVKILQLDENKLSNDGFIAELKQQIGKIVSQQYVELLLDKDESENADEVIEFKTRDSRIVSQVCYPVNDSEGNVLGTLWIFEDITSERRTAEQLIYLAEHDFLTGVVNRRKFQEELETQLAISSRNQHSLALLFFDIDDFKYINDVFGHEYGDEILQKIATEISRLVRRDEMFCRLGGDEFAILLPEGNASSASNLAERILKAVSSISLQIQDKPIKVTSSIGISIYPEHASDVGALLACADVAMYQSKDTGKNTWSIYEKSHGLSERMLTRVNWINRIDDAFESNLFEFQFQGVFDCENRQLFYYEALIRMKDCSLDGRFYAPSQFIAIAERSGKIQEIDHWVVKSSIKFLAEHSEIPCLAINVSGCSFSDDSLSELIVYELERNDVSPDRLMLEITETAMVSDIGIAQNFINVVRGYGCQVCIDDFGSGYSSFIYLKHLNVDVIKIDGMFTHSLSEDYKNQIFVKAIVDLAKGLKKKTVAEFVEDEETLLMLREFGVDFVQGFYLQEPQTIPSLIEEKKTA